MKTFSVIFKHSNTVLRSIRVTLTDDSFIVLCHHFYSLSLGTLKRHLQQRVRGNRFDVSGGSVYSDGSDGLDGSIGSKDTDASNDSDGSDVTESSSCIPAGAECRSL